VTTIGTAVVTAAYLEELRKLTHHPKTYIKQVAYSKLIFFFLIWRAFKNVFKLQKQPGRHDVFVLH